MLHVENEGGGGYLQRGGEKKGEVTAEGGDGESRIIDLIFFFSTN